MKFNLFKKKITEEQKAIGLLSTTQENTNAHLIALARLIPILPSTLVREAKNHKANGEYILQMLEAMKKEKAVNDPLES